MASILESAEVVAALKARGFEVEAQTDSPPADAPQAATAPNIITLVGRRDHGAPCTVWIDAGGTVRYQRVRLESEGPTTRVTHAGRDYRVTQETQQAVNAWGRLDTAQDVATVLDALEELTVSVTQKGT